VISLGDVATLPEGVAKEMKELPLGNAPTLGHGRKISRMLVKVRLISSGYDLSTLSFSGSDLCDVAYKSTCVAPSGIVDTARRHLASYFPADLGDVEINLANDALLRDPDSVQVATGEKAPELRATLPQANPAPGNVRVDVEIIQNGVVVRKVPVNFILKLYKRVVVAQMPMAAGQKLTRENLTLSRRELSTVRGVWFDSIEAVINRVAAVPLQPAQVITGAALRKVEPPVVIEANQSVFLVVQTETLKVVTLGKALSRARLGEVARAKNLATGFEVAGVAGNDSTIHVLLGGPSDAP
jgi:flagella basal body P-ring formation protein FlgA